MEEESKNLSLKEKRAIQDKLAKDDVIRSRAKSLLVISLILLAVGLCFLPLSWKYNQELFARAFTPYSIEFIVCCVCLGLSIFCLIYGLVRLLTHLEKKNK